MNAGGRREVNPLAAPIGLALGPLILKPLYCTGLCDAVVWIPPTVSRWLMAK